MPSIKSLATILFFCGLLSSCGPEPKPALSSEDLPVKNVAPEEAPVKDTVKAVEENPVALTNDSLEKKITEAALKANEEIEPVVNKTDKEEEEKERRRERHAERKEKEVEQKEKTNGKPAITFKEMTHNYGRISQGEKVKYNFVFTNTGDSELVITNAKATCGCTQPSFPFMPIAPGEEGYIGVIFDSKGRLGRQKPMITITTNAKPATYDIYLEGTVDSDDTEEEKKEDKKEEGNSKGN